MYENGEPCHIVNTVSIAENLAIGENGPYTTSKFAVVSISENFAQQFFNINVGVTDFCLGFINTDIAENFLAFRENQTDLYQLSETYNIYYTKL